MWDHGRSGRQRVHGVIPDDGTIREEEIDLSEYRDFADAYGQLGRFLDDVSNRKRIHSSLSDLTPAGFEQQWLRGQKVMALP